MTLRVLRLHQLLIKSHQRPCRAHQGVVQALDSAFEKCFKQTTTNWKI